LNSIPEHIDDLLAKMLTGEASAQEAKEAEFWIHASDENRRYFIQLESLYRQSAAIPDEDYNVDAAWLQVKNKLTIDAPVIDINRKSAGKSWLRIAAAVIMLIAVGSVVLLMNRNESPEFAQVSHQSVIHDSLPDGSKFVLNTSSEISYAFDQEASKRIARLKGEAFFEVVHDEKKEFVVDVDDVFIRDIGTAFSVTALPGSDSVVVFVREGMVSFYTNENAGMELQAGEEACYIRSKKEFIKKKNEDELSEPSWADHEFNFRNATLRRVIKKINKVYGDKLQLDNDTLGSCRISVNFRHDDPGFIAEIIAETMGWNVVVKGEQFVLSGEACADE
jgi:transmembrane sensor